jgi:hypothetical protein
VIYRAERESRDHLPLGFSLSGVRFRERVPIGRRWRVLERKTTMVVEPMVISYYNLIF